MNKWGEKEFEEEQLGKFIFSKRSDSSYKSVQDKMWCLIKSVLKGDLNNWKGFQGDNLCKLFLARGQTADPNPSKKQKPGQKPLQIDT